jgi:hypothetical protein
VAANQPLILSSGSIVTDNGKPSLNFNGKILTSSFPYTNGVRYTSFQAIKQLAGAILGATTNTGGVFYAVSDTLGSNSFSGFSTVSYFKNGNPISGVLRSSLYNVLLNEEVVLTSFITNTSTANLTIGYPGYSNYNLKEKIIYSSDQSSSRQPIEQNINNYFNLYYQPKLKLTLLIFLPNHSSRSSQQCCLCLIYNRRTIRTNHSIQNRILQLHFMEKQSTK